jgi:predicted aspartyl protease
MIRGQFNSRGELIFEIELIATDGDDEIPVNVLLDTGFTGWLAIDNQDSVCGKVHKYKPLMAPHCYKVILIERSL